MLAPSCTSPESDLTWLHAVSGIPRPRQPRTGGSGGLRPAAAQGLEAAGRRPVAALCDLLLRANGDPAARAALVLICTCLHACICIERRPPGPYGLRGVEVARQLIGAWLDLTTCACAAAAEYTGGILLV